jgi:hypothetical protein
MQRPRLFHSLLAILGPSVFLLPILKAWPLFRPAIWMRVLSRPTTLLVGIVVTLVRAQTST